MTIQRKGKHYNIRCNEREMGIIEHGLFRAMPDYRQFVGNDYAKVRGMHNLVKKVRFEAEGERTT